LLSILTTYYFLRLVGPGQKTRADYVGFVVTSALAYQTHYFAVLLPVAQYFYLPFSRQYNKALLRQWVAMQSISFTPLLIWVIALLSSGDVSFGIAWIPDVQPFDLVQTIWNLSVGYWRTEDIYLLPAVVGATIGIILGIREIIRHRRSEAFNIYWIIFALAPVGLIFLVSVLLRPLYVDRYFVFVIPGVIFLMLYGLYSLKMFKLGTILIGIIFLSSLIYGFSNIEQGNDEIHGWAPALSYVEDHFQPGDNIILNSRTLDHRHYRRYTSHSLLDNATVHQSEDILAEDVPELSARSWIVFLRLTEIHDSFGAGRSKPPLTSTKYVGGDADYSLGDWVCEQQSQIADYQYFNGLVVVLLDHTATTEDDRSALCTN
jgi:hypothetical protein